MTVEQFAEIIIGEFDEGGILYTTIEDHLNLIFDNYISWSDILDKDVYDEFIMRLEDPTAVYCTRVKEFFWEQKKNIFGNDSIVYSDSFEGFQGFQRQGEIKNQSFNPQWIPEMELFIKAVSESLQVDYGMVAPAVLSSASLAVVKKCIIHIIGDHREPPNLYSMVVAESSERKSPTIKSVTWPIYEYEKEENERRGPDISRYELKKKILEKRVKNLTEEVTNVKKKSNISMEDILEAQRELDELEEVAPLRLIADDITAEALIKLMSQNDERIAIISTEGGIFGNIAGRYSNSSNMDIYLKGYSGDYLSDDRVGRKGNQLKEPLLSVLLYVQPIIVRQLMENEEFVGRGLPARFLYTYPVSKIGKREYKDDPIPEYRMDDLWNIINRLLKIPIPVKPVEVRPDKQALKLATSYFYEVDQEILKAPSMELRSWIGKLHGNTMRVALVLHCIKHLEEFDKYMIDAKTMSNAIEIGRFFMKQAVIVYSTTGLADPQEVKDAKFILQKIDAIGKMEMKLSDIQQLCKDKAGLETKKKIVPGINCLIKHGYIRVEKIYHDSKNPKNPQNSQNPKKGGRPQEMVYVNPEYFNFLKKNQSRNNIVECYGNIHSMDKMDIDDESERYKDYEADDEGMDPEEAWKLWKGERNRKNE